MLTKEEWRNACIVALILFGVLAAWYCVMTAKDYNDLNEKYEDLSRDYKDLDNSYDAEKHIVDMMEDVIVQKNRQIEELESQLPK